MLNAEGGRRKMLNFVKDKMRCETLDNNRGELRPGVSLSYCWNMLCSCWDVPPAAFFSVSRNLNIQYFAILDTWRWLHAKLWELTVKFFVLLLFYWKVIDKHYCVCFVFLVKVFINFFSLFSSSTVVIEPLRSERPRPRPPSQPFLSDCVHARHISSHSVEALSLNRRSLTARGDQEFKHTKHSLWARWRCRKSQRIALFHFFRLSLLLSFRKVSNSL